MLCWQVAYTDCSTTSGVLSLDPYEIRYNNKTPGYIYGNSGVLVCKSLPLQLRQSLSQSATTMMLLSHSTTPPTPYRGL